MTNYVLNWETWRLQPFNTTLNTDHIKMFLNLNTVVIKRYVSLTFTAAFYFLPSLTPKYSELENNGKTHLLARDTWLISSLGVTKLKDIIGSDHQGWLTDHQFDVKWLLKCSTSVPPTTDCLEARTPHLKTKQTLNRCPLLILALLWLYKWDSSVKRTDCLRNYFKEHEQKKYFKALSWGKTRSFKTYW